MSLPEITAQAADAGAFRLAAGAPGTLSAQGPLTFASARRASELGAAALSHAAAAKLEIDCRGITASDSAGLAVLLEWLSVARRAGRSLRYAQLPEGLAALARISDLEELLERGV
ncbi:MAG TPA: STAS domain-containing protein [Steroidobacteraceae bacterium]|nr:STAS domain-containing protein [Steroidobacteraceae bacterium]